MQVRNLAPSLTDCVTWAELLTLPMPQFCHLQNKGKDSIVFTRVK
jgi:hypothetical protein